MPRRPRIFVEGGIYHVYNRFARGAELFADPKEAIEFLEILRKVREAYEKLDETLATHHKEKKRYPNKDR